MKYINAAEILPKQLLKERQTYIDGSVLYVPKVSIKKEWGATSGAHTFYQKRNREIQNGFMKVIRWIYYLNNMDWHIVQLKK